MKVDLVWLSNGTDLLNWPLGKVIPVASNPTALAGIARENLVGSDADAWLFWDSRFGDPAEEAILQALETGDHAWHAGLRLDTGGQPDFIDFVSPTWMLNRDPEPDIEATSWRLSLRACLIRTEVLKQLGGPRGDFDSLDAAGLELGLRYIRNGVFIRHLPALVQKTVTADRLDIPVIDQLRFIKLGFGTRWMNWAVMRAFLSGRASLGELLSSRKKVQKNLQDSNISSFAHPQAASGRSITAQGVSVLIPTINRYPYLRVLLGQLRSQTVKPLEIHVIDQTPEQDRDRLISQEFEDLPLKWFTMEKAGQCSSRNYGLQKAAGDFILFLDDDDEIPPDLIESHLKSLVEFNCRVSNGVALETGMQTLPNDFTFLRLSNVFPTNNSMIDKSVLSNSGLFDLAYDHGQRADGDLGMRIYLSGERMVLNPAISVLHHHAPQGGLRTHKARVKTHAASRQSISLRVLPSVSDIYLAKRYFSSSQVREMLWISVLGTFSLHGQLWKKMLKMLVSLIALPGTLWKIKQNCRTAEKMMESFPQIPALEDKAD